MRKGSPKIFWVEVLVASLSGFLFLLTLIWRDWIERVFGFDPDHHSGSLEWLLVAALFLAMVSFGALARRTAQHGVETN